jgi:hypothetical protein
MRELPDLMLDIAQLQNDDERDHDKCGNRNNDRDD